MSSPFRERPAEEIQTHMDETLALIGVIEEDVGRLSRAIRDHEIVPQYLRRDAARTIFASIEAVLFRLKESITLFASHELPYPPSLADQVVLLEQEFFLDDDGSVKQRKAKLRFLPNLRFVFRVYSEVLGSPFMLDVSGAGYQAMRRAIAIRDRLMHPKSVADMEVTSEELGDLGEAWGWYTRSFRKLMDDGQVAIRRLNTPM